MSFQITALYAPLLIILVIVLSTLVTIKRSQTKIAIFDGGNLPLGLAMRRHGNLVETLPLALILMALCEARGLGPIWLHAMGVVLIAARLTHAIGLSATNVSSFGRIAGGLATELAMAGAILFLFWTQFA
ncbi:MAG: MAPEG family protein [Devosia sp.]